MAEIYNENIIPERTTNDILGGQVINENYASALPQTTGDSLVNPRIIGGIFENGSFRSSDSGARLEIFPSSDPTIGQVIYDDGGSKVFKALIGGTDVGDVIMGDSSGEHAKWDKSASTFTIVGGITADTGAIGGWVITAGYIYSLQSGTPTSTPNDGLVLASGNEGMIVYENTEKRVELGYLSAGVYGIKIYADDGSTVIFEASDTQRVFTSGMLGTGSEIAIQGWQSDLVFSASDYRTVAWAGGTVTLLNGVTYSITGANTGNMAAITYIYLDIGTSTTLLQTTTTAGTAVGSGKILIAVAEDNSDTSSNATYQVFGGTGGQMLAVDNIAANSASVNEFVSNTAQIKDAIITNAKISSLAVDKLTAGTITSKSITLAVGEGDGDVKIQAGKTDFTNTDNGFILGIDDSDSNRAKFYIGDSSNYANFDGVKWLVRNLANGGLTIAVSTSESIQTAIDAVNAAGGGRVIVLNGTHTVGNDLVLYSNIYLQGENADSAIVDFNSGAFGIVTVGTDAYSAGTVAITNGSTALVGSGTTWTSGMIGRKILLSGIWYTISAFTDTTHMTIVIAYADEDLSGASYVLATTKEDVKISDLTIINSTTSAVESRYVNEFWMRDVNFQVCTIGLDIDDASNVDLHGLDFAACGTSLDFDDVGFTILVASGSIDTTSGNGFEFTNCANLSIFSSFILSSTGDGFSFTGCSSISVIGSVSTANGGQGYELVSGNTNIFIVNSKANANTSDGIKLTATSDRCIISTCIIDSNGGYGVNIAAADCDNNVVRTNQYNNNSSGRINDSGTGTVLDTAVIAGQMATVTANGNDTTDRVITTNFRPKFIELIWYAQGYTSSTSRYLIRQGRSVFNETTNTFSMNYGSASDKIADDSAMAAADILIGKPNETGGLVGGDDQSEIFDQLKMTITINAVTDNSFTIRCVTTESQVGAAGSSRARVDYIAYE